METRILVPLDGSRLAEQALSCAMTLGRGLPAELVLFRAVSIPSDVQAVLAFADMQADALLDQFEIEANDYLRGTAHSLRGGSLDIQTVVHHGPAAESIVDYAEAMGIDQIVMATHGYTGIKRWRHGSVAERVLQSASVPVLLVRAKEGLSEGLPEACPCRRILVPLDGSELAEQVLPTVTAVAQALGCELVLFQVTIVYHSLEEAYYAADQDVQAYLARIASRLIEQGIEVSTATGIGAVAESIVDHAEVNDVDLIAMCTHGRTGIARWALGSVADRVLRAGDKPILLVRARREKHEND